MVKIDNTYLYYQQYRYFFLYYKDCFYVTTKLIFRKLEFITKYVIVILNKKNIAITISFHLEYRNIAFMKADELFFCKA